jgi:hypothetical protein
MISRIFTVVHGVAFSIVRPSFFSNFIFILDRRLLLFGGGGVAVI